MQHARIAGFDGVRGIAVVLVVAFHLWPGVVPGGFLGVTLFFALSGYLITSLLLDEVDRSGSVSLGGFYQRRVRRILPAAVATVSAVAVVWFVAGWATSTTRRELFAALLQVTNWQQIVDGGVYGASTDRSPVLHFWSLAIEEQVYLVLPLVVLLARRRWVIGVVLGVLVSATALGTWVVAGDTSLVYFSTYTRSGEMLIGAMFATVLHGRSMPRGPGPRVLVGGLGVASLGGLVALGAMTSLGSEAYYRGGLLACGAFAAVGVAAVAHLPDLGARLDVTPLRWVGERSYGIYLVHWPLLLGFTAAGLDGWVLPVATIAATLAVSALSLRFYERPIRVGRISWREFAVGGAVLVAIVPAVTVLAPPPPALFDFEEAANDFSSLVGAQPPTSDAMSATSISAGSSTSSSPGSTEPRRPVTLGLFGDSKMRTLALGAGYDGPDVRFTLGFSGDGCPIGRAVAWRYNSQSPPGDVSPNCYWTVFMPQATAGKGPIDIAMVWFGTWDLVELQVPMLGDGWWSMDDVEYRQWLLGEMIGFTGALVAETGARRVVWLTVGSQVDAPHPEDVKVYNDLLLALAQIDPAVRVVDIAGWIASTGEAARLLPDSVHLTYGKDGGPNSAAEVADRFLTAELLEIFDALPAT